jgi:hypothetical protein
MGSFLNTRNISIHLSRLTEVSLGVQNLHAIGDLFCLVTILKLRKIRRFIFLNLSCEQMQFERLCLSTHFKGLFP